MASMASATRHLKCQRQLTSIPWRRTVGQRRCGPLDRARALATESNHSQSFQDVMELAQTFKVPFDNVQHARPVPETPSYFSREPKLNDLHIRLTRLLAKYHHLPTVPPGQEPKANWINLEDIRARFAEPLKAAQFAQVRKLAKRLNTIAPSLSPPEIKTVLQEMQRYSESTRKVSTTSALDKYGRAIATGKRKESTARAFVVEGTGEILINGKTLSQVFGRVHDRESAVWALTATRRLDKYNVWALVEGGGVTGQAEALTLAVAKALVCHEPALKPALKKAGCITRDPRVVERKKHGHVKARKMPAWVKR